MRHIHEGVNLWLVESLVIARFYTIIQMHFALIIANH